MNGNLWIVSNLKAYAVTFLIGMFAGFALGAHASHADAGMYIVAAFAVVALAGSWRDGRNRRSGKPPSMPRATLAAQPSSAAMDDAQAALATLGYSAREARTAVAAALATLDDDAEASEIVRAVLRARRG
jgi:hypothetical protein